MPSVMGGTKLKGLVELEGGIERSACQTFAWTRGQMLGGDVLSASQVILFGENLLSPLIKWWVV